MRAKRQPTVKQKLTADETATLLTHVRELQVRLLVTAVVLVGAGVVAYLYYGQILDILRSPLNAPLYYNSVSGSFSFVMKICMVAGIAVSVPLIVYNFIMFVRPAFIEVFTRKRVFLMTIGSVAAAAAGAVFGFTFVIPGALHFFSGFQVHGLNELISADSYLNFVINTLITFILMFQLPIVVSLIDRLKPISPKAMLKGEKWALIGSVIISLLVPFAMDFTVQLLIAAPIFILYNLSFLIVVLQHSYRRKLQKKTERVEARLARREQKTTARPVKRPGAPMPAAATQTLAPHPQLAEVFALQAGGSPVQPAVVAAAQQPVHRPVHRVRSMEMVAGGTPMVKTALQPVHAPAHVASIPQPVVVTPPAPTPTVSIQSKVAPRRATMDGFSASAPRTQPTSVIRQAGPIQAPQRGLSPARSLNFMADIR